MEQQTIQKEYQYAGFWVRAWAIIIDLILLAMITMPILIMVYGVEKVFESEEFILGGVDLLISWIIPTFATIALWVYKSATPGKMIFNLTVVDEKTGNKLTVKQSFKRYFFQSIYFFPIFMGALFSIDEVQMVIRSVISFLIVLIVIIFLVINKKKKAFHDKMAKTVVIQEKKQTAKVVFE
jgi:uncharacterized RDD family membrane protein YckC